MRVSERTTEYVAEVIAFIDANGWRPGAIRAREAMARVARMVRRVEEAMAGEADAGVLPDASRAQEE